MLKGHETVQLVGNESLLFDDAAIAGHLMLQMGGGGSMIDTLIALDDRRYL